MDDLVIISFTKLEVKALSYFTIDGKHEVNLLTSFPRHSIRYNPDKDSFDVLVHKDSDVATPEGREKFLEAVKKQQDNRRINIEQLKKLGI